MVTRFKTPAMMHSRVIMLSSTILFLLLAQASAHAFISWPRQIGLMGNNNYGLEPLFPGATQDYCPQCLNGGGRAMVEGHAPDGKWTPYEPTNPAFPFRDDHGLCGDPKGSDDHMATGKYYTGMTIATYEQGDYIDIESLITAHHKGFYEFFACNLDCCGEDDISKECFEKKCCEKLMRVPHKSCETGDDPECAPVDLRYPGRWYLPEKTDWYGGMNKKMRYALPKGMTCNKCMIHWAWVSANSCNPPGYVDYKFPDSIGGVKKSLATCGEKGSNFPEEFWSCSEKIRIVKKNGGKDRSLQIFRNGEMEIEGPDGVTPPDLMEQTPEPVITPPVVEPNMTPVAGQPKKENPTSKPTPSPTPNPDPVPKDTVTMPRNETEVIAAEPVNGSSYDLSAYIRSYDTGTCLTKKRRRFCEACLDLGYGVTKCFWCTRNKNGVEKCLHRKP